MSRFFSSNDGDLMQAVKRIGFKHPPENRVGLRQRFKGDNVGFRKHLSSRQRKLPAVGANNYNTLADYVL